MTRTLRMILQYRGTHYRGWQAQAEGPTVQGVVEESLERILGQRVRISGAGRTDAGVHARGQVASFRTICERAPGVIRRAANARLPKDIRIMHVEEAPSRFHALTAALGKEYRYQIWIGEVMPPFLHGYALHCESRLEAAAFGDGARRIMGEHDFSGFASRYGGSRASARTAATSRTVTVSTLERDGDLWSYRIQADGFLYKMVRTIAGTLIEIARGRWSAERVDEILASKDRALAGPVTPPHGLFLEKVFY